MKMKELKRIKANLRRKGFQVLSQKSWDGEGAVLFAARPGEAYNVVVLPGFVGFTEAGVGSEPSEDFLRALAGRKGLLS